MSEITPKNLEININANIAQATELLHSHSKERHFKKVCVTLERDEKGKLSKKWIKPFIQGLSRLNADENQIYVIKQGIKDPKFDAFIKELVDNANKASVWISNFSQNEITNAGVRKLPRYIHSFKGDHLSLDITENPLTETGLKRILEALNESSNVAVFATNTNDDNCPIIEEINNRNRVALHSLEKELSKNRNPTHIEYVQNKLIQIMYDRITSNMPVSLNEEKQAKIMTELRTAIQKMITEENVRDWNQSIEYFGTPSYFRETLSPTQKEEMHSEPVQNSHLLNILKVEKMIYNKVLSELQKTSQSPFIPIPSTSRNPHPFITNPFLHTPCSSSTTSTSSKIEDRFKNLVRNIVTDSYISFKEEEEEEEKTQKKSHLRAI